ncbi:MAG: hypothetical protein KBD78_16525 [Oligoflexales bacterium]|nr:hypothetical protein [Oligoflexales bacterium]
MQKRNQIVLAFLVTATFLGCGSSKSGHGTVKIIDDSNWDTANSANNAVVLESYETASMTKGSFDSECQKSTNLVCQKYPSITAFRISCYWTRSNNWLNQGGGKTSGGESRIVCQR